MQVNKVDFPNVGYLIAEFSDEELEPIRQEARKFLRTGFENAGRFNQGLAGHLNNEYHLVESKSYIESLVRPLIDVYRETFPLHDTKRKEYTLENTWINFQKKHEFNPVHFHIGIFSFALWLRLPYDIQEEKSVFPHIVDTENITANFCFQYTDALGNIQRYPIPADRTYQNKLLFFPAEMRHFVNPFYTSDEYRISVSGNFV